MVKVILRLIRPVGRCKALPESRCRLGRLPLNSDEMWGELLGVHDTGREAAQATGRALTEQLFMREANEAALLADVAAARRRREDDGPTTVPPTLDDAMLQMHSFRANELFSRWIELKESIRENEQEAALDESTIDTDEEGGRPAGDAEREVEVVGATTPTAPAGSASGQQQPLSAAAAAVNAKDAQRAAAATARAAAAADQAADATAMGAALAAVLPDDAPAVAALVAYAARAHTVAGFFETALLPLYAAAAGWQVSERAND